MATDKQHRRNKPGSCWTPPRAMPTLTTSYNQRGVAADCHRGRPSPRSSLRSALFGTSIGAGANEARTLWHCYHKDRWRNAGGGDALWPSTWSSSSLLSQRALVERAPTSLLPQLASHSGLESPYVRSTTPSDPDPMHPPFPPSRKIYGVV